ncbi:c-type cytochrome [Diaphorobacter ruginosibacter]|uniref:c-type cytochrome n=1 Tax=Diaphorobacter ruginosibacter TaxID=1715720 RepID=UPI001FE64F59|nr:cytochrome c [Diaphorobacter ruginosibacter]
MNSEWVTAILRVMLGAQLALRDALHVLGWTPEVAGQAAWPFTHRLAADMMWIDAGHARQVALTGLCMALAMALLAAACVLAILRRPRANGMRKRWLAGCVLLAVAALVAAPWPAAHLLWVPATPTSLHRSETGFEPAGILRGQALFRQHCQQCHGADARGQGVLASSLERWPPDLSGGLVWKRLEGELFWRIRHGMRDERTGRETMPGIGEWRLADADVWNVIDYLQAHAAGQALRNLGAWEWPVRLPRFALRCRYEGRHSSADLQGQRLLLVLPVSGPSGRRAAPGEDPRLVSIVVGQALTAGSAECESADTQLQAALALLLGESEERIGGYQLLVDRDGWLRARSTPGSAAWSEDDLVCRTAVSSSAAGGGRLPLHRRATGSTHCCGAWMAIRYACCARVSLIEFTGTRRKSKKRIGKKNREN